MEINLPRVDVHQNIDNIVVTLYLFEFFSRVPHGRIEQMHKQFSPLKLDEKLSILGPVSLTWLSCEDNCRGAVGGGNL